ncbi:MAG: translation elongation factor Ts [Candidatus Doudnabacteria bacterium RIFCSPHIGHO2_02_FULL_46_11]|uniref:Elongation factor Ts n=1 Tax=Candidatus Doudnabacteria bacterium RIFCSPHIGHO2_02_FULL_46_11 TaxID=1817832 RepID=A0A1F5P7T7_9BACT|nr:MAG: translation elongation factor Ts [Candidatus Doudnabacteria bacterium RIFCSPHIGHO2_02_FULL_46_11]
MSEINQLDLIKELREETGAGMMDVKSALAEAGGDPEKAVEILRKKGLSARAKKSERQAKEGLVSSYIHAGGRIGVLLEVNCETDFVARTDDFKNLVSDLAMHIAAAAPMYLNIDQVPADVLDKEKEIAAEQAHTAGKPENVLEKIVDGRIAKFYEEVVLMEQKFIKNPDQTINDLVGEYVGKLGENIQIRRFERYVLGA